MGPHGMDRVAQRIVLSGCWKGLGVKIIGGYRELTNEDYGVFIKRVLPGGVAALDGRLKSGDLLLGVNDTSLSGVTSERAVEILRLASATNHMSLLVVRDDESWREFTELMEKYGSDRRAGSGQTSPSLLSIGKMTDSASSSSSSGSTSPLLMSPWEPGTSYSSRSAAPAALTDNTIHLICVAKGTGLGLVIKGGANRAEGPMVFIQEILPGGDCQKDGRLRTGDQLLSINKESFIGITYEEARSILLHTKQRSDPTVEIAFIRQRSSPSSSTGPQSPISPQPGLHWNGQIPSVTSPLASLVPETSSTLNPGSETLPSVKPCQIQDLPGQTAQTSAISPQSATAAESGPGLPSVSEGAGSSFTCKRISITRFRVENLKQALESLGITPTEEESQLLRERLQTDSAGTVARRDFEAVIRELFKLQISNSVHQGLSEFTSDDLASQETSKYDLLYLSDSEDLEEIEKLRKDHSEALTEIKTLQDQLAYSEGLHRQTQDELMKVTQETVDLTEGVIVPGCQLHNTVPAETGVSAGRLDNSTGRLLQFAEIVQDFPQKTKVL